MVMPENKTKGSIRINGTTFNKAGVASMSKEEFVASYLKVDEVFRGLDAIAKERRLMEVYEYIVPSSKVAPKRATHPEKVEE